MEREDRPDAGPQREDGPREGHANGSGRETVGQDAVDTGPVATTPSGGTGRKAEVVDLRRRKAARGDDTPGRENEDVPDDAATAVGWRELWRVSRARRRALRAESKRFTARTRRRRRFWSAGVVAVVLLVGGTVGAAYSPLFAVHELRVVGTDSLDAAEVTDALSGQLGVPLPLVDHSEVKASLLEFPLIETFSVEARPPHGLVVRIVERTPVGVVESDAGYTVVDAAGVALATSESRQKGQPVISVEGGTSTDAFVAVGQVLRSLPEGLHEKVTGATATTSQDVSLTLGEWNATVVWGSAEESAMKAVVLDAIMQERPPSEASTYDVSSPSAIVVQ